MSEKQTKKLRKRFLIKQFPSQVKGRGTVRIPCRVFDKELDKLVGMFGSRKSAKRECRELMI